MPGRWTGSVREEPEGRGGGVVADHRADVGLAVAGVLGAVRGVDVGACPGVRLSEPDVAVDAAGADAAGPGGRRPAEPAAGAPAPGADVQLVADPDHPDRRGATRGAVGPGGRDVQLVGGTDAVQLVAGPVAHHASRAVGRI